MPEHVIVQDPDNVQWGYYDSGLSPILTVTSGDVLEIHTEPGVRILESPVRERASEHLRRIVDSGRRDLGGHILTGPIAVEEASAGDVLEVRFLEVWPRYDWGFNVIRPLAGGLPEDFPYARTVIVEIDAESNTGDWGAGVKVPLSPYFGNFGVAPPDGLGRVPSTPPGIWGGNMDNKELVAGTRAYLPVFQKGALFAIGDGHGCQGDGESCLSALECGMSARVQLLVRKDLHLEMPRAETPTHHVFMGFDPILDNAAKAALRQTIRFLGESHAMSKDDAYTLCSLAVDLRITQIVNGVKGVHAMLPKELLDQGAR